MEKRYQVFVRSTYSDLQEERSKIIQTLVAMDCIPAGMELFPAADEEQWTFIKRIIDDCDYYIVIVGNRYGTLASDGLSYTEKEFDYALERNLKVLALIHEKPDTLPTDKSDIDSTARHRLQAFRERLRNKRIVKSWIKPDELPALVALSLQRTIKMSPAIGWIRASHEPREELLQQLNQLRQENKKLETELAQLRSDPIPSIIDLAEMDDNIIVPGTYEYSYAGTNPQWGKWSVTLTWRQLFGLVSPFLMESLYEWGVEGKTAEVLFATTELAGKSPKIEPQTFQTIKLQLLALRLVTTRRAKALDSNYYSFWSLTPIGRQLMFEIRTVRKDPERDYKTPQPASESGEPPQQ